MSNVFSLLSTLFFSFAALILACIACAGSTKNYTPINQIYVAQVDLTGMSLGTVIPSISSSTSLSSILPSYYNIGLWSYCKEDDSKKITSCTSPDGIEKFDLKNLLYNNIEDNNVVSLVDDVANIVLPEKLQKDMKYYNDLAKCMFITLIVGIVLVLISFIFSIARSLIHIKPLKWFGVFFAFLAFVCLIISAGTSMATYIYISHILKDNKEEYGIKLSLGKNYFGIIWGSVVAALINFFSWCFVRSRPNIQYIQTPYMEKREML